MAAQRNQHALRIRACRRTGTSTRLNTDRADDRADGVGRVDAADQRGRGPARASTAAASASGKLAPQRNAAGSIAQRAAHQVELES